MQNSPNNPNTQVFAKELPYKAQNTASALVQNDESVHDTARPIWVKEGKDGGWDLLIWVQPGAKKHEVVGCHDGRLKIRLAAPAVENKANKALLAYLAKTLKIKQNKFSLESGDCARHKRLRVEALSEPDWTPLNK